MNQTVHTTTGQQPSSPPSTGTRQGPPNSRHLAGDDEELAAAMPSYERHTNAWCANIDEWQTKDGNPKVSIVWVRRETPTPRTCKKLNPPWDGVYKVVEVKLDGSVHVSENVFTGRQVQRAAAQVKPYRGDEEWLLEPPSRAFEPAPEDEDIAPWIRRRPRPLIEEC